MHQVEVGPLIQQTQAQQRPIPAKHAERGAEKPLVSRDMVPLMHISYPQYCASMTVLIDRGMVESCGC